MKLLSANPAANDVSVRDWQVKTSQFVVGKSFDTHCL